MIEYALTKRAEVDLFDIFLFGYEQFGARQAENYAAELQHAFQLLADNPRMGPRSGGGSARCPAS
jgi:toxin ParE1/3/4